MVLSISAIHAYNDPEYLRIIQELRKLGIAPSGNKSVDKAKLEKAKAELVKKIQEKQEDSTQNPPAFQVPNIDNTIDSTRTQMEEKKLGAMTLAELNRLYHNL